MTPNEFNQEKGHWEAEAWWIQTGRPDAIELIKDANAIRRKIRAIAEFKHTFWSSVIRNRSLTAVAYCHANQVTESMAKDMFTKDGWTLTEFHLLKVEANCSGSYMAFFRVTVTEAEC